MENLIIVEQLPIIIEKLENIKQQVIDRVQHAKTCACTTDMVKEVKKYRTDLRKEFEQLEEQRKTVKEDVMKPYLEFESKYKECITSIYLSADMDLKAKIDEVENGLKDEKEKNVREYFDEYITAQSVKWLEFENIGINITLSVTEKKLKEEVKAFVDKVISDLEVIGMQSEERQAEILIEYKKTLRLQNALQIVTDRHAQLARMKEEEEKRNAKKQEEREHVQSVERVAEKITTFAAPKVEALEPETPEKKLVAIFKVSGTLEELRELKKFLEKGGYKYEC